MLNIHKLSISFQGEYLFEDISFRLKGGDRVGLIGKNGAGKSTLLKILANEMEYDSGQVATEKELKIGFLKQDIDFVYHFDYVCIHLFEYHQKFSLKDMLNLTAFLL